MREENLEKGEKCKKSIKYNEYRNSRKAQKS